MQLLSMKNFAKSLNNLTFTDYYIRLKLLAKSVFTWENLPNGMDEKWIESILFSDGKAVFFSDKDMGFMVAKCAHDGGLNAYDEPTHVTPYATGYNGERLEVNQNCVIIRNNFEMLPTEFFVKLFAYRLADITRSIDINVNAQKTPILLTGPEKIKLSLKNIYNQFTGNEPAIYGSNLLDNFDLKVLKTDAPIVFPQLQTQKQTVWNEALTFLGINNSNFEKRERLITNEVEANNENIELSAEAFFKGRKNACEKINELFGTNIKVKFTLEGDEK